MQPRTDMKNGMKYYALHYKSESYPESEIYIDGIKNKTKTKNNQCFFLRNSHFNLIYWQLGFLAIIGK